MKKLIALLVVVFAVFVLAACAPASSDKAKAKMEKAGYTVTWTAYDKVQDDGGVGLFTATAKGGIIPVFYAQLYDSSSNAKKAFNDAKDAEGKAPENLELVGKWVVYGDADAIKAFK